MVIAVDISDWLWNVVFDEVASVIKFIKFSFLIIVSLIFLMSIDPLDTFGFKRIIKNFHHQTNVDLKNKKQNTIKAPLATKGLNWILAVDENKYLSSMGWKKANIFCTKMQPSYKLPAPEDLITLEPYPVLEKQLSFWTENKTFAILPKTPEATIIENNAGDFASTFTICIKQKGQDSGL